MHGPSQIATDGEAESNALMGTRASRPQLHERLAAPVEVVGGNVDARWSVTEPNESRLHVAAHRDPPRRLGELEWSDRPR